MWIYFDKTGKAIKQLEHGTIARQGSVGVYTINAVFEDTDLSEYTSAIILFQRPDGTGIKTSYYMDFKENVQFSKLPSEYGDITPFEDGKIYPKILYFKVNDSGIFSQSGIYKVTIILIKDGVKYPQGIFSISVQGAVVLEPMITEEQYEYLLEQIGSFVKKDGSTIMMGDFNLGGHNIKKLVALYNTSNLNTLELSNSYLNSVLANTLIRPYQSGIEGQFSSMVNNVHDDDKNSDYQYRMNFDGETDNVYIDTHLSKTGSIYTAVTGENAYITHYITGKNASLTYKLDDYAPILFYAVGDSSTQTLNYAYLGRTKDGERDGTPLFYLYNSDNVNANKYGLAYDCSRNQLGYIIEENGKAKITDLTYVPRLDTNGFRIYAHSGASQFDLPYDLLATPNAIVQRTSNGNVLMTTPTEDLAGANKKYVDGVANNKLDKLTTDTSGFNGKLYAHSSDTQIEFGTTAFSTPNSIPYRNENGTFDVRTPINEGNVTNKEYVDAIVSTVKKNSFTLVNTTTYTTLDSFLNSTGEEGYVYLYPINLSDTSEGYYQYIWEGNAWLSLGSTALDLTNYLKKDGSDKMGGDLDLNHKNINNVNNVNSKTDINKFVSSYDGQTFTIETNNQGANSQSEIRVYKTNSSGQKRLDLIFYDDVLDLACQTTVGTDTEYAYIMEIAKDGTCDFLVGVQCDKVPTNNKDLVNKEYVDTKIGDIDTLLTALDSGTGV